MDTVESSSKTELPNFPKRVRNGREKQPAELENAEGIGNFFLKLQRLLLFVDVVVDDESVGSCCFDEKNLGMRTKPLPAAVAN